MNINTMQQRLNAELMQVRQQLISSLANSNKDYHQFLLSQLQNSAPNLWLELVVSELGSEYSTLTSRLEKLEAAMCQIEIGQYGYCCDCEEPIGQELLTIDPATQRCKHCAR